MSSAVENQTSTEVPEIVHIVLSQAEKQRRKGLIPEAVFQRQLRRIITEEMEPRHLTLLVRALKDGRTRFVIKRAGSRQVSKRFEGAPLAAAA